MSKKYSKVVVEAADVGIRRIALDSPQNANAQDVAMLYELNDALMEAAHDPAIRVIILAGIGKHFSSGHDLKADSFAEVGRDRPLLSTWDGAGVESVEAWFAWEHEMYLDMCKRWRGIAKPVIAQVQGACIAGGLMLAWVCDLIIAADDAYFQDPVVDLGIAGVEYFAHVWEIGSRRAKEKLFTADRWTAQEALEWGMVNRVVPRAALAEQTLALAKRIAAKPTVALKLAKDVVNHCVDAQGFDSSLSYAFAIHHLGHAHNRLKYGTLVDPAGVPEAVRKSYPGGRLPEVPTRRRSEDGQG